MPVFRNKPIVIEAVKWEGRETEIPFPIFGLRHGAEGLVDRPSPYVIVPYARGRHTQAFRGDWLAKHEDGAIEIVPAREFEARYVPL